MGVSAYINNVHVGPYQWRADWLGASKGVGRPLTGVPKLVLGGPVKLGGLPTRACSRTPTLYTTGPISQA